MYEAHGDLSLILCLTAKHFPIKILRVISMKIGFHKQNFINEKTIYGYPDSARSVIDLLNKYF